MRKAPLQLPFLGSIIMTGISASSLVEDLEDAIGIQVNDGAMAIDHRSAIAGSTRDRSRLDAGRQRLALFRGSSDGDDRGALGRAVVWRSDLARQAAR